MISIDDKIAILIDEGYTCEICKYVDCKGTTLGPNGPFFPPCADDFIRCIDEEAVEEIFAERSQLRNRYKPSVGLHLDVLEAEGKPMRLMPLRQLIHQLIHQLSRQKGAKRESSQHKIEH